MSTQLLRAAHHVKSVIDSEGAVLLDVRGGRYFSLNGIAVDIWQKLEEGVSREQLETYLASTYDAPQETLHQDCDAFLERLERARLIERAHD